MEGPADDVEDVHVHRVYEQIAHHFSCTRSRMWPMVERFLERHRGALIADIGCGNGKYPYLFDGAYWEGCDRSLALAEICRERSVRIVRCDGRTLPYRDGIFDAVICIAVVHHYSTEARRVEALEELLRVVRPGGRVFVTVWARSGKRAEMAADALVPWTTQRGQRRETYERYYHLFEEGELSGLAGQCAVAHRMVEESFDQGNWAVELERI